MSRAISTKPSSLEVDAGPLVAAVAQPPGLVAPDAIYLGMGVCSREALSTGALPLDALAMMLLADQQRRLRGADQVVHLIADDHALVNDFADPESVRTVADALQLRLETAVESLGFAHYGFLRASQIDDALHRELHYQALSRCSDRYAARQAADVEWARRRFGATVKVGWTMEPRLDVEPHGFDERYFDAVHRRLFGDSIAAVYGHPGRRVDPVRPRTSPYTIIAGESRLTLDANPRDIVDVCQSRSMRRHLRPLCDALARVLELPLAGDDLHGALAAVLNVLSSPTTIPHDAEEQHHVV